MGSSPQMRQAQIERGRSQTHERIQKESPDLLHRQPEKWNVEIRQVRVLEVLSRYEDEQPSYEAWDQKERRLHSYFNQVPEVKPAYEEQPAQQGSWQEYRSLSPEEWR